MVVEAIECSRILCLCVFCLSRRRRRYSASTRVCVQSYRFQYGIGLKTSKKIEKKMKNAWDDEAKAVRSRIPDYYTVFYYMHGARMDPNPSSFCRLPALRLIMCDSAWCALEKVSHLFGFYFSTRRRPIGIDTTDWLNMKRTNGCNRKVERQSWEQRPKRREKNWSKLCRFDL